MQKQVTNEKKVKKPTVKKRRTKKKPAYEVKPFDIKKIPNKVWKPRKFKTVEEFFNAFVYYCEFQVKRKRPITKTSFKAYLLLNHWYFNDLPEEYSEALKKIDLICKAYADEELFVGKNVAGVIFNLCNNYSDEYKNSRYNEHVGKDWKSLFDRITVQVVDSVEDTK